jgi:FkbM family methyltransferase
MICNDFLDDYNLDALELIVPKNRAFQMFVPPRYRAHYCHNSYEEFTADTLLNIVNSECVFMDIGANFGFYTLLIGTRFTDCKIFSFEPVETNFNILNRNLSLNSLMNVKAFDVAVSNKADLKEFCIVEASDSCGFSRNPLTNIVKMVSVNTVALDEFLDDMPEKKVVVKIDTEGHEIQVLEGMKEILLRKDVKVVIEFNPKCLKSAGFDPSNFLESINQLGLDIYIIDDNNRHILKLNQEHIGCWEKIISENTDRTYTNLLCLPKQKSISICMFSHSSQLAGAERSLLELTKELICDYGAVCTVVLPDDGPLKDRLHEVGASVCNIDYRWWCNYELPSREEIEIQLTNSFANYIKDLNDTLLRINPDVIISHTLVIPWGAVAASFLEKPHIWYVSEFGEMDHGLKFYLPFQNILKIIEGSSNLILTNSITVKNLLFGQIKKPVEVVYRYIEPPKSNSESGSPAFFKRPGSIKLSIIGTIAPGKGQHDAVLATNLLLKKNLDVELTIAGYCSSPDYLDALHEMVSKEDSEDRIFFCDFLENPFQLMEQSDIILVCSRMEAFGRTTVEAMLLKKPVIGSNSGYTPELVCENQNGLLYEAGDYEALAEKIEFMVNNKEKIVEFGENGQNFIQKRIKKEEYGWKVFEYAQRLKRAKNIAFNSAAYVNFLKDINKHLASDAIMANSKRLEIEKIQEVVNSAAWKLVNKYYRIRDSLFPERTIRGRLYGMLVNILRGR